MNYLKEKYIDYYEIEDKQRMKKWMMLYSNDELY